MRASNLVAGDVNGQRDVFIHDRDVDDNGIFDETGQIETFIASVDSFGAQGNYYSFSAAVSADGAYVAFVSLAENLVLGDINGRRDIFVNDIVTGETIRASVSTDYIEADNNNFAPAISSDGKYVAFESDSTNLIINDNNGVRDIFVRNMFDIPLVVYYCDVDGDTYISSAISGTCNVAGCEPAGCQLTVGNDCNDADGGINPAAADAICNGVDDNCNGTEDDDYVVDAGCGVGICQSSNTPSSCVDGVEILCLTGVPTETPEATCDDTLDNDCDGSSDAVDSDCGIPITDFDNDGITDNIDNCYMTENTGQQDTDGDGYGNMCDADLDNNSLVESNDYTILGLCWMSNDTSPDWTGNCEHADFDSNGIVESNDYTQMGLRWFTSAPWY